MMWQAVRSRLFVFSPIPWLFLFWGLPAASSQLFLQSDPVTVEGLLSRWLLRSLVPMTLQTTSVSGIFFRFVFYCLLDRLLFCRLMGQVQTSVSSRGLKYFLILSGISSSDLHVVNCLFSLIWRPSSIFPPRLRSEVYVELSVLFCRLTVGVNLSMVDQTTTFSFAGWTWTELLPLLWWVGE